MKHRIEIEITDTPRRKNQKNQKKIEKKDKPVRRNRNVTHADTPVEVTEKEQPVKDTDKQDPITRLRNRIRCVLQDKVLGYAVGSSNYYAESVLFGAGHAESDHKTRTLLGLTDANDTSLQDTALYATTLYGDMLVFAWCLVKFVRASCDDETPALLRLENHVCMELDRGFDLGWLSRKMVGVVCSGARSGWNEMVSRTYGDFVSNWMRDVVRCLGTRRYIRYRKMYRGSDKNYEDLKLSVSGYGVQTLNLDARLQKKFDKHGRVALTGDVTKKSNENTKAMSALIVDFDDLVCVDPGTESDKGCVGLRGLQGLVRWLDDHGVGYLVHSTSKHTWKHPRLRVLVPLSGPVSAEDYKSHYLALMHAAQCSGYDTKCMSLHRYFVVPKIHVTKHPVFCVRAGSCLDTKFIGMLAKKHIDSERDMKKRFFNLALKEHNERNLDAWKSTSVFRVPVFPADLVNSALLKLSDALQENGINHRVDVSGNPVIYIRCVNHHNHKKRTQDRDTYITLNTKTSHVGMPVYYCAHASCANLDRSAVLEDLLGRKPYELSILNRAHLHKVVRNYLQGAVPGVYNKSSIYPKCLVWNPGGRDSVVFSNTPDTWKQIASSISNDPAFNGLYADINLTNIVSEYMGKKLHGRVYEYPKICRVDIVGYGKFGDDVRRVLSGIQRPNNEYLHGQKSRRRGKQLGTNMDHPIIYFVTGCFGDDVAMLNEYFRGVSRAITHRSVTNAVGRPAYDDVMKVKESEWENPALVDRDVYWDSWSARKAMPVTILDWTRMRMRSQGRYQDIKLREYDGRQKRVLDDVGSNLKFKYRMRGMLEQMHLQNQGVMIVCCWSPRDVWDLVHCVDVRTGPLWTLNKFKKLIGLDSSEDSLSMSNGSSGVVTTLLSNEHYKPRSRRTTAKHASTTRTERKEVAKHLRSVK